MKNENKFNVYNCTLRIALRGTNRGVHNHHFHAGFAGK
jgi:hypothetical protein